MLIVDNKYCRGCKLCEKNCPTGAIKVIGRKARIDNNLCNECYRCVYTCPSSAIKQKIEKKEKIVVSNKKDLKELSTMLSGLKKRLDKIEKDINSIGSKVK